MDEDREYRAVTEDGTHRMLIRVNPEFGETRDDARYFVLQLDSAYPDTAPHRLQSRPVAVGWEDDVLVWDPDRDQQQVCACGHVYYRHFDSWHHMRGIGCKSCLCPEFKELT